MTFEREWQLRENDFGECKPGGFGSLLRHLHRTTTAIQVLHECGHVRAVLYMSYILLRAYIVCSVAF